MCLICLVGRPTIAGHVSLCQNGAEEMGEHSYITWSLRGMRVRSAALSLPTKVILKHLSFFSSFIHTIQWRCSEGVVYCKSARQIPCTLDLETKVAEDYAKFHNHGEGPYQGEPSSKLCFKLYCVDIYLYLQHPPHSTRWRSGSARS